MTTKKLLAGLMAVLVAATGIACADGARTPLAPSDAHVQRAPRVSASAAKVQVTGLQWKTPLAHDVSAAALIGPLGGVLDLPATGLRVVVPAGAVLTPTQFGVTALAGPLVAYDFQPAGSKFLLPLLVRQEQTLLDKSTAPRALLTVMQLGYFPSVSDLDQARGVASVSELLPAVLVTTQTTLVFPVWHFSGYILAWGVN